MELTAEQREAVEKGLVVKCVIPESRVECVVVRKDMLDPLRARADYSPCDSDDLAALTAEVLDDEDWTMPEAPHNLLSASPFSRSREGAG